MNRYIPIVGIIFLASAVLSTITASQQKTYRIAVAGTGKEALVDAIKRYSDITKKDVNKWKYSWVPGLGGYVRSGIIDKISKFIAVCEDMPIAKNKFSTSEDLWSQVPVNWNINRVCLALKNLEQQGDYALSLFGSIEVSGTTEEKWFDSIQEYIKNIRHNRSMLGCSQLKESKQEKEDRQQNSELQKLLFNTVWWKNVQLKWKIAKEVGQNVFAGTKWLVQTANEYSAPVLSAGAVVFAYHKLFGLPQVPALGK